VNAARRCRRILLTGATGFIGSHLARLLIREGQEIFAVIRPGSDRWRLHDLLDKLTVLECDLTDTVSLAEHLRMIQPELCIHLAWRGWSGTSIPEENLSSLSMSLELMRLIVHAGCRRFVATGTCLEYDMSYDLLSEETPLRSDHLYGTCKSLLFQAALQFSAHSGLEVVWPRIFYFYGPYEDERRLVPSVLLSLLRGQVAKTTAGEQVRDYLYVEDVVSALWTVAQSQMTGAVNIASGTAITVRDVISHIAQLIGKTDRVRLGALAYRPGEPMSIRAEASRLRQCGWSPQYDLPRGLHHTIAWWKERLYSGVRA